MLSVHSQPDLLLFFSVVTRGFLGFMKTVVPALSSSSGNQHVSIGREESFLPTSNSSP